MADMGSLEKMGRELKCPICLSLLSSAVSITCNHIFCNDCLIKSMKSASSCPMCKVPFHRRELRPASHMDNLVSIFKSMEAAAGTNVVSSQTIPASKGAGESTCGNNRGTYKRLHKSTTQKKKAPSKKKNNTAKATTASASCPNTKPSFSTNKRIHVTPFPEAETPIRPEKIMKPEQPKNNGDRKEGKDEALASGRPDSPSLSPFFWLREEEGGTAETLSQPLSLDTPLRHNAPSFSDIKDSDDEFPINMTPNELQSRAKATEAFDSEIFEWTQRPCSPELCSTPLKNQGKLKNMLDQITEKDDGKNTHLGDSSGKLCHASNVTQSADVDMKQKRKNARARSSKNDKLSNCGNLGIKESDANQQDPNCSKSLHAKSCQKSSGTTKRNTSNKKRKASKDSNPVICTNDCPPNISLPKDGLEVNKLSEMPQKMQKRSQQKKNGKKLGIARDSIAEATQSSCEQRNKRFKKSDDVTMEISAPLDSGNKKETSQLYSPIRDCNQYKPLAGRCKRSKLCGELNNTIVTESKKSNIAGNAPKILPERCQSNGAMHTASSVKTVSVKDHRIKGTTKQSDCSGTINFGKLQACTAPNVFVKKCEATASKVLCAFCQSDDITEDSGEMVHYHNGRQVTAEFYRMPNVIHSHKNCLEWAPDVYFEGESVFNLATELARSRRIKCACCGVKGAPLGCFEMSCRKSFHFTCAKLVPECRWDNENFVMLCPLHHSSKLPNETSGRQKQSKRRIEAKGPSQERSSQDCGNNWKWPSGLPQKWVLCWSALSAADKGIVLEFAKLAGVPISTSWSPTVTHVITSTDQSGACKRTLKFLMAILNGRWIVSLDWVKTCMDRMEPVDEQNFEALTDVHGICDGPRLGRQKMLNKQAKLFDGMRFYLHGDYSKSYRGYLQDLVAAAGGALLQRKPVSRDQQKLLDDSSPVFIVYGVENQEKTRSKDAIAVEADGRRETDAHALACASGGRAVSSAWIIDSIAACSLQPL